MMIDTRLQKTFSNGSNAGGQATEYKRGHPTSTNPSEGARKNELIHRLRQPTKQATDSEDAVGEYEARFSSENVTQFSVQWPIRID